MTAPSTAPPAGVRAPADALAGSHPGGGARALAGCPEETRLFPLGYWLWPAGSMAGVRAGQ